MTPALKSLLDAPAPPGPEWLAPIRQEAAAEARRLGLPTSKHEDWKYTPLAALAATAFHRAAPSPLTLPLTRRLGSQLVFVDGRLAPAFCDPLPEGVTLHPPNSALLGELANVERSVFSALNTALFEGGALLRIAEGARPTAPIVLAYLTTGAPATANHPRLLVQAAARSESTLVELYEGEASQPTLTNAVTEIWLGEDAQLRRIKVQHEGPLAFHIATLEASLAAGARLRCEGAWLGGALSHDELGVTFAGPGASCELRGLFMGNAHQHLDQLTRVDHACQRCESHELYKGIVDGAARGVFSGHVVVRAGASGTDAHQQSRNLLLSDDASIDARPQLAIYTDDVRCTHGAAIGQLDDEALFYLRSRGIPASRARALLVEAFACELVEPLPAQVQQLISPWIHQKCGGPAEVSA